VTRRPLRLGIMGFGRIGRQLYRLACQSDDVTVVAISDIGRPEILHHLLTRAAARGLDVALEGNYLVTRVGGREHRSRLMHADRPAEVPWDLFEVDLVVDATARFRTPETLEPHLNNGAPRVLLSTLPEVPLDRLLLCGVNEADATAADRLLSAGSASTLAMALVLATLRGSYAIEHATMTSVHAYTSDQSLQDYAGPDYRRSRSGAENIIPNDTQAPLWIERVMPELAGRLSGYALNVPVQTGSMLDASLVFAEGPVDVAAVHELFENAARARPELIATVDDPIVSSDVHGLSQSLLVDLQGTLRTGGRMLKLLAWHETLCHAARLLDVARLYAGLQEAA